MFADIVIACYQYKPNVLNLFYKLLVILMKQSWMQIQHLLSVIFLKLSNSKLFTQSNSNKLKLTIHSTKQGKIFYIDSIIVHSWNHCLILLAIGRKDTYEFRFKCLNSFNLLL